MKALLLGGPKGGETKTVPICRSISIPTITLNGPRDVIYEAAMQLVDEEILTVFFYRGTR